MSPPVPPAAPPWLGLLGVHQDLIWFAVLLTWSFAAIAWRRVPNRRTVWDWVPWAAAAGVLATLLQFLVFNPPFDLFYERLVPGTNDTYTPALINPDLFADLALAGMFAAVAATWWWKVSADLGARALRWPIVLLCAGLVALHYGQPLLTGTIFSLLPLTVLVHVWRRTEARRQARIGIVLVCLLPAVSTVGPLAFALDRLQRFGPTGWLGAGFGLANLLAATVVLTGLFRDGAAKMDAGARRAFWRDARPFLQGGVLWLLLGTLFALRSGYDNAWEVKTNRMRTAASRAAIFNLDLLRPVASFPLHWDPAAARPRPDGTFLVPVGEPERFIAAIRPLGRELEQVVQSTPFLEQARFLLLRDGWLVSIADNLPPGPPGTVQLIRRATPADEANWRTAQDLVEELPVPEERRPYYCRAAVRAPDGTMLGWLDYVRAEFYSSMERKWRTGPLLVTALGAILAAAFFVQRRSSREREEALRAAAVAAEAGRIKTAFLAKVSHELRTPLQSILGYTELLQRDLPDPSARRRLDALQHHGQLMTRLVNDLIDLSALESGAFRLILAPVPLAELVQQTVDSLRPRADARHLALSLRIGPDLPAWIEGDAERIRQIVLNLLGNALKFTEQGRVDVDLRRAGDDAHPQLALTVADTGPGIPAADQSRLFEPFFRLELTARKEGSGLGLALVTGLCRSMGGTIEVESEPGRGARFTVRLPLRGADAPAGAGQAARAHLLRGRRVLVADDNDLVRDLFTGYLESLGATCREAADGDSAVRLALAEPFDAIVLDLAMPYLAGGEVARRIRAAGSAARIVGVSAHTDAADRAGALMAGMDAFLTKPVQLPALAEALAAATPADDGGELLAATRRRLAGRFRESVPQERARFDRLLAAADRSGLRDAAHHLKNSAFVVGDTDLGAACARLEQVAESADHAAIMRAWSECEQVLRRWAPAGTAET